MPIGRIAGQGKQQQMRAVLQRHGDAERGAIVVRQLRQHQPALRDALHPGADIRHQRAGGPEPVIESSQRSKRISHLVFQKAFCRNARFAFKVRSCAGAE
jgi:hypothetical protein